MNITHISGNLGSDPQLRKVGDTQVCNFSLAVNDRVKRKGEWIDETTWYRVAVWGGQAEPCSKYLSKGRKALVSGRVSLNEYEKDGKNCASLEINARDVEFLSPKNEGGGQRDQGGSGGANSFSDDASIPF